MNKIFELEREIELKKEELRVLKKQKHLNFDDYNNFEKHKYNNYSLGNALCAELRSLATRMVSIQEGTRTYDGSKYLTAREKPKVAEMTQDEVSFCNDLLRDLYPIIEKYAIRILSYKENK